MNIIVFQNSEALKNYSRTVASQKYGESNYDRWSVHAQTPHTIKGWPRVAIEKRDGANHIMELHFIDNQQVLDAANELQGKQHHLLTDEERFLVFRLADGDSHLRTEAEEILNKYAREHFQKGRKSVEMQFLSEVFSKSPDLMLRNKYRQQILNSVPACVLFDIEDQNFYHNSGGAMPAIFNEKWFERRAEFPQQKHS